MYKIFVDDMMICDSRIESLCVNNPKIELELNTAGVFTFSFPPTHPYIDSIQHLISVIRVENNDEIIFQGFCCDENEDMLGNKYIECEGELSYLNDSVLRQNEFENETVTTLLTKYLTLHNNQVEERKRFTLGNVTVTDPNNNIYCFTNMNPTLQEIKEDLIDDLGGYLFVRYEMENGVQVKYLDYLAEPLVNALQTIELGKNLINYESNINNEDIATRVIPLGKTYEEETYPSSHAFPATGVRNKLYIDEAEDKSYIWNGSAYVLQSHVKGLPLKLDIEKEPYYPRIDNIDISHPNKADYLQNNIKVNGLTAVQRFGYKTKVVEWDDVTLSSNLLQKGKDWLLDNQFQNVVISIKAIDLSLIDPDVIAFHLFDSIHVISEYHGMDRWFTLYKINIDLNNPENTEYILGSVEKKSLTVTSNSIESTLSETGTLFSEAENKWLTEAQNRVTAIINGSKGGVVVTQYNEYGQPTELRIQNALNNPSKIWRWNIGGFAYSNDGGQTWGSAAITMNGEIVADFITAGTIRGIDIQGVTMRASTIISGSENGLHIVYEDDTIKGYNNNSFYGVIKPQASWDSSFPSNIGLAIDSEGMLGFAGRISTRLSSQDNISYLTVESDQCLKSCTESDYHWVRGAGIDEGTNFYIPMAKTWTFHTVKNGLLVN